MNIYVGEWVLLLPLLGIFLSTYSLLATLLFFSLFKFLANLKAVKHIAMSCLNFQESETVKLQLPKYILIVISQNNNLGRSRINNSLKQTHNYQLAWRFWLRTIHTKLVFPILAQFMYFTVHSTRTVFSMPWLRFLCV